MKKTLLGIFILAISLSLLGCGVHFYKPGLSPHQPAEITVSAYTQQGCLDDLQEEARTRNVDVKLKDVQAELGWEIILWPLYKGYQCSCVVVDPKENH
jgi:outer membrane lipopolysaccharide assembly protein LptE/RlpB